MDPQTAAILDHISDGMSVLARDWRYVYVNRTAAQMAGSSPEALVGRVVWEVFPEAVGTPIYSALQQAAREGTAVQVEEFYAPLNRWFEIRAHPTPDGLVVYAQDVTERRQTEEALRERTGLLALGAEVGTALVERDTLRDMLRECAAALVRNLGAAFARIWTLNEAEGVLELQASAGMYTHLDGSHGRVPVGQFKIGLIAQERQPHLTNQVVGDPRVGDQEWARREGMVAFAGYPMLVDDRLIGVIALFARQPLSDATLRAMASVADEIALGIERKRVQDELALLLKREQMARHRAEALAEEIEAQREELECANKELTTTNEELYNANEHLAAVTQQMREQQGRQQLVVRSLRAANQAAAQLTAMLDSEQAAQRVVETLVKQFVATVACVWFYTPRGQTLRLGASAGSTGALPPALTQEIHVPTFGQKIGWVARTRRPFIGADIASDVQFDQAWIAREKLVAAGIYPLAGREELRGVLAVFSQDALPLETGEVLATLATILASSLDTLDLLRREREMRAATAAAEHRYRDLVNSLEAIVWEGDATTFQFTFVSEQAEKMLGYPVRRWTEEPGFWKSILHPEDRDWAVDYCATSTEQGMDHAFEYRALTADGSVRWLRDLVHVVRDATGQPRWLRGVMLDITDRKILEEELQRKADGQPWMDPGKSSPTQF